MAFKSRAAVPLFLSLNILFSSLASLAQGQPSAATRAPPLPVVTSVSQGHCPIDTLQFSFCANLLGLAIIANPFPPGNPFPPANTPCKTLIDGLLDFQAAVCFCGVLKAGVLGGVLGNSVDIPVTLNLLLNASGKNFPQGFMCPPNQN